MSLEIESGDVVKLMLQFCRENGLSNTLHSLQTETGVTLNSVDSVEALLTDVREGRWDKVLTAVGIMHLPQDILLLMHEQVLFELLESGAADVAMEMLKAQPLSSLRSSQASRWHKLDQLCRKALAAVDSTMYTYNFIPSAVYEMGTSKATRRAEIALALSACITSAPPARLLTLLGQALQFQHQQGHIPNSAGTGITTNTSRMSNLDLLMGTRRTNKRDIEEKCVSTLFAQIKLGADAHPEAAIFSPDGGSLVLGSIDGIIEVWNPDTCEVSEASIYTMITCSMPTILTHYPYLFPMSIFVSISISISTSAVD